MMEATQMMATYYNHIKKKKIIFTVTSSLASSTKLISVINWINCLTLIVEDFVKKF